MADKNNDFVFKKEADKKLLIYLIEYFGDGDLSELSKEDIETYNNIRRVVGLKEDTRWNS